MQPVGAYLQVAEGATILRQTFSRYVGPPPDRVKAQEGIICTWEGEGAQRESHLEVRQGTKRGEHIVIIDFHLIRARKRRIDLASIERSHLEKYWQTKDRSKFVSIPVEI